MFCPNCGTKTEAGQKYCRACGLSVEKLAGLIAERPPAGAPERSTPDERSTPEDVARLLQRKRSVERYERRLARVCFAAGSVFVILILAILIIRIIITNIIEEGELLVGSIFVGIFLIVVAALALGLYRKWVTDSLAARGVAEETAKQFERGATTLKLPEVRFDPATSVTDHTTELLAAEPKSRRQ